MIKRGEKIGLMEKEAEKSSSCIMENSWLAGSLEGADRAGIDEFRAKNSFFWTRFSLVKKSERSENGEAQNGFFSDSSFLWIRKYKRGRLLKRKGEKVGDSGNEIGLGFWTRGTHPLHPSPSICLQSSRSWILDEGGW